MSTYRLDKIFDPLRSRSSARARVGGARAAARSSKTSGRTRNRPGDLPAFAMLNQIQAASENALRVTISDS